jgi:hypothetical protein
MSYSHNVFLLPSGKNHTTTVADSYDIDSIVVYATQDDHLALDAKNTTLETQTQNMATVSTTTDFTGVVNIGSKAVITELGGSNLDTTLTTTQTSFTTDQQLISKKYVDDKVNPETEYRYIANFVSSDAITTTTNTNDTFTVGSITSAISLQTVTNTAGLDFVFESKVELQYPDLIIEHGLVSGTWGDSKTVIWNSEGNFTINSITTSNSSYEYVDSDVIRFQITAGLVWTAYKNDVSVLTGTLTSSTVYTVGVREPLPHGAAGITSSTIISYPAYLVSADLGTLQAKTVNITATGAITNLAGGADFKSNRLLNVADGTLDTDGINLLQMNNLHTSPNNKILALETKTVNITATGSITNLAGGADLNSTKLLRVADGIANTDGINLLQMNNSHTAPNGKISALETKTQTLSIGYIEDVSPNASTARVILSLRLVNPYYSGQCVNVRRSSDNATLDIPFSLGYLDKTAYDAFVGAGNGYIAIIYDQSRNGYNFIQATNSLQPQILWETIATNSIPVIQWSGGQVMSASDTSNFGMDDGEYCISTIYKTPAGPIMVLWGNVANNYSLNLNNYSRIQVIHNSTVVNIPTSGPLDGGYHRVSDFQSSNTLYIRYDGTQSASSASNDPTAVLPLYWGAANTTGLQYYFTGVMSELIIYDVIPTDAELLAVENDQLAIWSSGTLPNTKIIVNADLGLTMKSKTDSFTPPKITSAERALLHGREGNVIYNTSLSCLNVYAKGKWETLGDNVKGSFNTEIVDYQTLFENSVFSIGWYAGTYKYPVWKLNSGSTIICNTMFTAKGNIFDGGSFTATLDTWYSFTAAGAQDAKFDRGVVGKQYIFQLHNKVDNTVSLTGTINCGQTYGSYNIDIIVPDLNIL